MNNKLSNSIASALSAAASVKAKKSKQAQAEETITESALLSSMGEDTILSSVSAKADQDTRSMAMAIAQEWAKNDTNDFDELEAMVAGAIAGIDYKSDSEEESHKIEPDEMTEDDMADFNELFDAVGEALISLSGMEAKKIQTFIDDEKDEMAPDIINAISERIKGESEAELVSDFAVRENLLLSSQKRVVRDNKLVYVKKRIRKRKMSARQRAALKKTRLKANTAAAKAKRAKSNRLRKRSGL